MNVDTSIRPKRAGAVRWKVFEDEGVLVDVQENVYFTLNPVGLFIWDRCTGDFALGEIIDQIVEEFDVDPETAAADVRDFLDELHQQNLVLMDHWQISPAG